MPFFCAITPKKDIHKAITPQQNPFTKPETILLYLGKVFCAKTKITGWANIVVKPINPKTNIEAIGIVLYINPKISINGNVAHKEKYITFFEPSIFSSFGLKKEASEPAKTNKNKAKPI